ncbi:MAG TPA: AgmX/PglI C-terminal domain-containing protein [Haliangiales bacterium]|nr:AgmX/PglI C-terminal domain-containing protein [Haliangiales bacterium]
MSSGRIELALLLGCSVAAAQDFRVDGTLGRLDDAAVQKAVGDAGAAIEACYSDHVGALRYVGGKLTVRAIVSRDGKVAHAQVADGDLGAWPVEKCLIDLARRLDFGKPQGGNAEVRIPLEFAGRAPVTVMDEADSERELRQAMRALRAGCAGGPKEATVTAYVAAGGRVTSVGFASEAKLAAAWCDCAEKRSRSWQLSDPRGSAAKLTGKYTRGGSH